MTELAVIGSHEFTLGFRLAGIRQTTEVEQLTKEAITEIMKKKQAGIIIIDQKILDKLEAHERDKIESSVEPVFIPISDDAQQESLRNLIRKSIGVDLWKD